MIAHIDQTDARRGWWSGNSPSTKLRATDLAERDDFCDRLAGWYIDGDWAGHLLTLRKSSGRKTGFSESYVEHLAGNDSMVIGIK